MPGGGGQGARGRGEQRSYVAPRLPTPQRNPVKPPVSSAPSSPQASHTTEESGEVCGEQRSHLNPQSSRTTEESGEASGEQCS